MTVGQPIEFYSAKSTFLLLICSLCIAMQRYSNVFFFIVFLVIHFAYTVEIGSQIKQTTKYNTAVFKKCRQKIAQTLANTFLLVSMVLKLICSGAKIDVTIGNKGTVKYILDDVVHSIQILILREFTRVNRGHQ